MRTSGFAAGFISDPGDRVVHELAGDVHCFRQVRQRVDVEPARVFKFHAVGPRFAGKVSLELDFLEPRAARQLDEEWGINHSEFFFEAYYSMAGDLMSGQLPVSGWGWAIGLGFTF